MILDFNIVPHHFVCPRCGGTYFGSSMGKDRHLTRYCNGSGGCIGGCGFSWDEDDDAKYVYVEFMFLEKLLEQVLENQNES